MLQVFFAAFSSSVCKTRHVLCYRCGRLLGAQQPRAYSRYSDTRGSITWRVVSVFMFLSLAYM